MYIHTSSASAYWSFLQFLLFCLCSCLAINRNQYLRNATRMVSEFSREIHWSPEMFPIPPLYYLWYCSQIAPKVIKSTVFDKMGRSSKEEASLTLVS